jgi:hypothetical protein
MRLYAEPINDTPGIPSVIVTANRVDQFLSNTGSFTGSFTGQFTGSLFGTSSFATSASFVVSSSFAVSSSRAISSSFATTALTASNITPVISNDVDTRVITANGNGTLNAEGNLTFNGQTLSVLYGVGDEGGEILLGKPATNTTLTGSGVTLDVFQNRLRFFEQGGNARGYYLDITAGGAGASTNLASGGGTVTQVNTAGTVNGITLTGGPITGAGTITLGGTLSGITPSQLATSSVMIGTTNIALGATGSALSGLTSVNATSFTGSLFGTSSWATNALTASFTTTAQTASFVTASNVFGPFGSNSIISASFAVSSSRAVTSSFAISSSFAATASFLTGSTNAFIQGGNSFGTTALLGTNDNQSLALETSGSIRMLISSSGNVGILTTNPNSASLHVSGNVFATSFTGSLFGTSSWASNAITASFVTTAQTASFVTTAQTASFVTASNVFGPFGSNSVTSASFAVSSSRTVSASFAISSSFATTASFLTGSTNAFIQSGNSFGATALLGTNDNQNLALETSGSIRMLISSSGNVGILTTNPYSPLQVGSYTGTGGYSYGIAATFVGGFNANRSTLFIGTTDIISTQDKGGSIDFGGGSEAGSTPYTFAKIRGFKENSGADYRGYMSFCTTPVGSDANTERMRINSSGNVGIGTTTPTTYSGYTTVAINNITNGGVLDFMRSGSVVGQIYNNSTSFNLLAIQGVPLILGSSGVEAMRIAPVTNNIYVKNILVAGGASTVENGRFYAGRQDGNLDALFSGNNVSQTTVPIFTARVDDTATGLGTYGYSLYNSSNVLKFSVDKNGDGYFSGSVGIGTTTPAFKLDIRGVQGAASVVNIVNTTNNASLYFGFPTISGGEPSLVMLASGQADGRVLQRQLGTKNVYMGDIDVNGGSVFIRANGNDMLSITSAAVITMIKDGSNYFRFNQTGQGELLLVGNVGTGASTYMQITNTDGEGQAAFNTYNDGGFGVIQGVYGSSFNTSTGAFIQPSNAFVQFSTSGSGTGNIAFSNELDFWKGTSNAATKIINIANTEAVRFVSSQRGIVVPNVDPNSIVTAEEGEIVYYSDTFWGYTVSNGWEPLN